MDTVNYNAEAELSSGLSSFQSVSSMDPKIRQHGVGLGR